LVLVAAALVVALVSGALWLLPRSAPAHVVSTEEIRTSHGGHHHRSIASWTSDDSDDDGIDDDEEIAASPVVCPLTPVEDLEPHTATPVVVEPTSLGPSNAHTRSVERPPRA
jgi:hypothetical protein